MKTRHKVLTVKEFVAQGGAPQFHVIARRDKSAVLNVTILRGLEFENSPENKDNYHTETIFPEEGSDGLIQIVQRISDEKLFHQGDYVTLKNNTNVALIFFHEDRIHCTVVDLFDFSGRKRKIKIEEIASASEPDFDVLGEDGDND